MLLANFYSISAIFIFTYAIILLPTITQAIDEEPFVCAGQLGVNCRTRLCYDSIDVNEGTINSGCASEEMCIEPGCNMIGNQFICCCEHSVCNGKSEGLIRSRLALWTSGHYHHSKSQLSSRIENGDTNKFVPKNARNAIFSPEEPLKTLPQNDTDVLHHDDQLTHESMSAQTESSSTMASSISDSDVEGHSIESENEILDGDSGHSDMMDEEPSEESTQSTTNGLDDKDENLDESEIMMDEKPDEQVTMDETGGDKDEESFGSVIDETSAETTTTSGSSDTETIDEHDEGERETNGERNEKIVMQNESEHDQKSSHSDMHNINEILLSLSPADDGLVDMSSHEQILDHEHDDDEGEHAEREHEEGIETNDDDKKRVEEDGQEEEGRKGGEEEVENEKEEQQEGEQMHEVSEEGVTTEGKKEETKDEEEKGEEEKGEEKADKEDESKEKQGEKEEGSKEQLKEEAAAAEDEETDESGPQEKIEEEKKDMEEEHEKDHDKEEEGEGEKEGDEKKDILKLDAKSERKEEEEMDKHEEEDEATTEEEKHSKEVEDEVTESEQDVVHISSTLAPELEPQHPLSASEEKSSEPEDASEQTEHLEGGESSDDYSMVSNQTEPTAKIAIGGMSLLKITDERNDEEKLKELEQLGEQDDEYSTTMSPTIPEVTTLEQQSETGHEEDDDQLSSIAAAAEITDSDTGSDSDIGEVVDDEYGIDSDSDHTADSDQGTTFTESDLADEHVLSIPSSIGEDETSEQQPFESSTTEAIVEEDDNQNEPIESSHTAALKPMLVDEFDEDEHKESHPTEGEEFSAVQEEPTTTTQTTEEQELLEERTSVTMESPKQTDEEGLEAADDERSDEAEYADYETHPKYVKKLLGSHQIPPTTTPSTEDESVEEHYEKAAHVGDSEAFAVKTPEDVEVTDQPKEQTDETKRLEEIDDEEQFSITSAPNVEIAPETDEDHEQSSMRTDSDLVTPTVATTNDVKDEEEDGVKPLIAAPHDRSSSSIRLFVDDHSKATTLRTLVETALAAANEKNVESHFIDNEDKQSSHDSTTIHIEQPIITTPQTQIDHESPAMVPKHHVKIVDRKDPKKIGHPEGEIEKRTEIARLPWWLVSGAGFLMAVIIAGVTYKVVTYRRKRSYRKMATDGRGQEMTPLKSSEHDNKDTDQAETDA